MGFYDSPEGIEQYIQMAEGLDGARLIGILEQFLPAGSSVLELGMGPGKDLDLLYDHFKPTGSDTSQLFLDRYLKLRPDADLLLLDAAKLDTERTFDVIYSNKVLHHLSRADLKKSFKKQWERLNPGGLIMHSFWLGDQESYHQGLRFVYHSDASIQDAMSNWFEIAASQIYTEIDDGDSFWVIGKQKNVQ